MSLTLSLKRIWSLIRKEFALGPRNPILLFVILVPFIFTLLIQVAFGSLFEPRPRLGIVDEENSELTAAFEEMEGMELTIISDTEELKMLVKNNDLDAGIIIAAGFDEALKAGEQPLLEFYIGGESLASNRIIVTVMALDLIRAVEGSESPVEVEIIQFGEEGLPISLRLVPFIVFYAIVMAGVFLPGSAIVEEKEKGTINALLVTPVTIGEILAAKWFVGIVLASLMGIVTLLLNSAFGPRPFEVVLVVIVAAAMNTVIGLLVGIISKTSTALFAIIKGTGIFLFAPVVFYIFPEWPQWIAKIFPLYWIIEPIWQVSIMGKPIANVWFELTIAVAITVAMLIPLKILTNRMSY